MKIKTIEYSESRQLNEGFWKKIGLFADLEEGDSTHDCLLKIKETVGEMFNISGVAVEHGEIQKLMQRETVLETKLDSREEQIKSHILAISLCQSKTAVERYRKLVERENNEGLTTAFNNKLQSL